MITGLDRNVLKMISINNQPIANLTNLNRFATHNYLSATKKQPAGQRASDTNCNRRIRPDEVAALARHRHQDDGPSQDAVRCPAADHGELSGLALARPEESGFLGRRRGDGEWTAQQRGPPPSGARDLEQWWWPRWRLRAQPQPCRADIELAQCAKKLACLPRRRRLLWRRSLQRRHRALKCRTRRALIAAIASKRAGTNEFVCVNEQRECNHFALQRAHHQNEQVTSCFRRSLPFENNDSPVPNDDCNATLGKQHFQLEAAGQTGETTSRETEQLLACATLFSDTSRNKSDGKRGCTSKGEVSTNAPGGDEAVSSSEEVDACSVARVDCEHERAISRLRGEPGQQHRNQTSVNSCIILSEEHLALGEFIKQVEGRDRFKRLELAFRSSWPNSRSAHFNNQHQQHQTRSGHQWPSRRVGASAYFQHDLISTDPNNQRPSNNNNNKRSSWQSIKRLKSLSTRRAPLNSTISSLRSSTSSYKTAPLAGIENLNHSNVSAPDRRRASSSSFISTREFHTYNCQTANESSADYTTCESPISLSNSYQTAPSSLEAAQSGDSESSVTDDQLRPQLSSSSSSETIN